MTPRYRGWSSCSTRSSRDPRALFRDTKFGARQDEFRSRLLTSGVTARTHVRNPGELEVAVLHALMELPRARAPSAGPAAKPLWSVPPLHGDEVARPPLVEDLVAAVLSPDASAVALTTGFVGAGGFGKTTLARMVAHDPRMRARFPGGVVWVTVGEDTGGPDLAAKLVSAARLCKPGAAEVTDPMAAGAVWGQAVADRRVLLVVDESGPPDRWSRSWSAGNTWCGCSRPACPGCCRPRPCRCGSIRWPRARRGSSSQPDCPGCRPTWWLTAAIDGAVAGAALARARRSPGRASGRW